MLSMALASLWNRRLSATLTVFSVAISVALVVGVDRIRTEAKSSFGATISGTDLIVGARSGPINLLLYSVFRIGDATNNISWTSYRHIAERKGVAWAIPISLGDSHRGYRVLATTGAYFEHYRFGGKRPLTFNRGGPFSDTLDAVLGADVARELGYDLDRDIVLSHGIGGTSFLHHGDMPFKVAGILEKTGTPVDRTVHIGLEGMEAIHSGGLHRATPAEEIDSDLAGSEPDSITAVLLGLDSRLAILGLQRYINEYAGEPLLAIIPGVALQQLWGLVRVAETALVAVTAFVVLAGLLGMSTTILASLNERRREMAILRSVGARPAHVFLLLVLEACLLAAAGAVAGILLVQVLLLTGQAVLLDRFGIYVSAGVPRIFELAIAAIVVLAAGLMSAVPALRAYRHSLADGMAVRL